MKIGIVTLQLHTNYGGVLQAFALQRALVSMGNDVEIIQLDEIIPAPKGIMAVRKFLTRAFRRYVLHRGGVEIFRERRINMEFPVVGAEFIRFFRKYMNIRYISSFDEIGPSDYDVFIVGSDQVWRPKYNRNLMNSYLDFTWKDRGVCSVAAKKKEAHSDDARPQGWDVRRIAYAVSFGSDDWEYNASETALASCLAGRFNALSFRELSGVENAERYLGVASVAVSDPTFLLSAEDYLSIVEDNCCRIETPAETGMDLNGNGRVFEYILDRTRETLGRVHEIECRISEVRSLDKHLEITRFLVTDPRGTDEVSARVQPSIESWITGISKASFVITDSFHACVFSILFHRPFVVIGNQARGLSRIEWLLRQFGLTDRLVMESGAIPKEDIDWEKVDAKLSELRAEAFDFLNNNLR